MKQPPRQDWARMKSTWMIGPRGQVELEAAIPPHQRDRWRPLTQKDRRGAGSYDRGVYCLSRGGKDVRKWKVTDPREVEASRDPITGEPTKKLAEECRCGVCKYNSAKEAAKVVEFPLAVLVVLRRTQARRSA